MPWDTADLITRRIEFIDMSLLPGSNFSELCRRFGLSRKTGYKWRARFAAGGYEALGERVRKRSRRANQTPQAIEQAIMRLRAQYPFWGPRKLRKKLQMSAPAQVVPSRSAVARLLKRENLVRPTARQRRDHIRFERPVPNDLWQMDFKGHFALRTGRCHPLTILDDHSRYLIGLFACPNEQTGTVQACLREAFKQHGMPAAILCDNGPPWGAPAAEHTALSVWLLRMGVRVLHGRPPHPQTQGKDERFHRTLKAELLDRLDWRDLAQAQTRFDSYRHLYNHERPHDALDLATPSTRYQPSPRPLPAQPPDITYSPNELTRTVKTKGEITFKNRSYYIGLAFRGLPVALRPTSPQGCWRVCLAAICLGIIDPNLPSDLPKGHYHPLCKNTPPLSTQPTQKLSPLKRDTCHP